MSNNRNTWTNRIPEEELPKGHLSRFIQRLETSLPKEKKLFKFQGIMIAASIAALIAGILLSLTIYNRYLYQGPILSKTPGDFYETELYLKSEIQNRLTQLNNTSIDKKIIRELSKTDEAFKQVRKDLKENPGDMRLVSAVLDSYQLKIDFLDEVLNKIAD